MVHFGRACSTGHWRIVNHQRNRFIIAGGGATASGSSRSSRLIHRIMLFPFTLPAPRWRFTSRRRDDVQLTGRQPAHPPARGQLLIHAYPSPLSVPILQKPRPASLIPNRPAIAPLRKLRRAAGSSTGWKGSRSAASSDSGSHRKIQRLPLIFRLQQQSQAERLRLTAQRKRTRIHPAARQPEKARVPLTVTGSAPSRRRFLRTPGDKLRSGERNGYGRE